MSRRPPYPGQSKEQARNHFERLEQAREAKARLLTQQATLSAKRLATAHEPLAPANAPLPRRNRSSHLAALTTIPFWRLGDPQGLFTSTAYLKLAEVSLLAMENKTREAVLCWPDCAPSAAAIAVQLTLADCAAAPHISVGGMDALGAPVGLRALIYPYASTAHRSIRQIYADKGHVGLINTKHQLRATQPGENEALSDFHKVLARSKTLTGRALDGQTYDEFRHPCLDELIPFGPCRGRDGHRQLLWRVRSKTDLKLISRSGEADAPATARYYLFGLRAYESVVPSLMALDRSLDIVFLDLSSTGRSRLGRDWLDRIKQFVEQLDERVGPVATVALTDDPWTFDALRFEGLVRGPAKKTKAPPTSHVIFAAHPEIVTPSIEPTGVFSALKKQEVVGFSGEIEGVLKALRANTKRADELNDRDATDLLRQLTGTIRRCSSLPASRDDLSAYLESVIGGAGAADLQAAYRATPQVRQLRLSFGPWAQTLGKERDVLLTHVERVWGNTADLTPMAPMLRDMISSFLSKSSQTIVLFQKDMLADFATHALMHDPVIGEAVRTRLEKEMLIFLDRNGLEDISHLPAPRRNYIKTLIAVAPTRAQLLKLLAREWLPDNLIVLGDSNTLRACSSDARRLASHKELAQISDRLTVFSEKADGVIHRAGLPNSLVEPGDDLDFPSSSVVNLAGNPRADQPLIRIRLSGEQVLLARPGTKLIVQDTARAVPIFLECDANDVDVGDRICVVGDAFLEMARPLLNITVRAAEEIRDYHELVLERFAELPGESQSAKLAQLVAAIALPSVSVQRAHYWIDLEGQRDNELYEVIPHAPRDRETFLAFMRALGVSDVKSRHYWTWAVIAQRSSRLRAAISFNDAYRAILVDNYAAQSSDPRRSGEIRRLKAAAEDFVSAVVETTTMRGQS